MANVWGNKRRSNLPGRNQQYRRWTRLFAMESDDVVFGIAIEPEDKKFFEGFRLRSLKYNLTIVEKN